MSAAREAPLDGALHGHERVLESFDFNGAQVQLVSWEESLWCGKILFAKDNSSEPDVEQLMNDFVALGERELSPIGQEEGWNVCMSFNYLTEERPSGVFFGFRVQDSRQPEGFDLRFLPEGRYLRVEINEATARAMDDEPWTGGGPPYQWICEGIGPKLGFTCGDSALPVVEYYRHNEAGEISGCWLYVPVTGKK